MGNKWTEENYNAGDIIDMDFLAYLGKIIPEEEWEELLTLTAKQANRRTLHHPLGELPKKKATPKKKAAKKKVSEQ